MTDLDVIVVGAGTAGANVAHQFSRRGRRVLLLERRPADAAGAQWHNGVLDRHFDEAGLDRPEAPERVADGGSLHMRTGRPGTRLTMHDLPTVAADMARLGDRLRRLAVEGGVELIDRVTDLDVEVDPGTGRIRSVTVRAEGHPGPASFAAALFVDASGRRGVLRRHAPALAPWCRPLRGDELCSAADVHHRIADRSGAERFLDRHGARPGDSVTYVGISGGFSTRAVTVSADLERVGILVGCLANGRYSTGPRLVADFLADEPWIGEATSTGAGVIPLRRPFARTTAPGLALVGDAACQVFPAHGSGVGIGLLAGSMLAEGVADADDPGDPDRLWRGYQAPFQRRHGTDLIGFDVLRRATTRLGEAGVDAMVRSGVIDEDTTRAGLEQRWAVPSPAAAARAGGRMARHPRLAATMAPALARAQAARAHASRYPAEADVDALARWEARAEKLVGPLPR
ncbi:MAG: NAD(P)/FAD-dependent oxidoreductase [Acidimicrobiales bacterium]|nr:NAD(P)/FAD-dependent oxidoreductase [Acidimicrobiales bacterium]